MAQWRDNDLPKGRLRKLTALRKSLGNDIADEAFGKWLDSLPAKKEKEVDQVLEAIKDLVEPLVLSGAIPIRTGKGVTIRRGRGRVIVEYAN